MKNVGKIDRLLRFMLALLLLWLGLFKLNGSTGEWTGLLVAAASLLPLYMAFSARCFVFRWFRIHSLSPKECESNGHPYTESNNH